MIDYRIEKISKIKVDQLSQFYQKVFKSRYKLLTNNWKWWYRLNYLDFEPIVLISNNKVVGQMGIIPVKIKLGNKIVSGVWYIDFAVLPELQGKGAGSKLVKECMKIFPIQMAFCNENALRVYKKFDWQINRTIKRLARPINPIKWMPILKNLDLKIFNNLFNNSLRKHLSVYESIEPHSFNNNSNFIFETFSKKKELLSPHPEIHRDEDWLSWRLLDSPFNNNIKFFEYKGNFAITHIIKSKNIRRLHIVFHYYLDESYEAKLYYSIAKWSIENNIDLLWSCSNDQNLINDINKILPKQFTKPITLASFSSDKNINEKLNLGFQNIQGIDSDSDIVPLVDNNTDLHV